MPQTVIEVEVLDEKFKAFVEAFDSFLSAVDSANKKLETVGKKAEEAGRKGKSSFEEFRKQMESINSVGTKVITTLEKVAKVTWSIASSVASTALNLAKWVAFGSVVSGFGFGELAKNVVDVRREALGVGISPGALRAARASFGQFGDVDSLLSNIKQTQYRPDLALPYTLLGITGQAQKDPMALLGEILQKGGAAYNRFKGTPNIEEIQKLLPADMLVALSRRKPSEISEAIAYQKKIAPQLEASEENWQRFNRSLSAAGQKLETSLARGLNKAAPALTKLTDAVTSTMTDFIDSPEFDKAVGLAAKGIEQFAKYLTSPDFINDMKLFREVLSELVDAVGDAVQNILHPVEWYQKAHAQENAKALGLGWVPNPDQSRIMEKMASSTSVPYEDMFAVLHAQAAGGATPSTTSAAFRRDLMNKSGLFEKYIREYAGMGLSASEVKKRAFAAVSMGDTGLNSLIASHKQSPAWEQFAPAQTQAFIKDPQVTRIIINNNTGTDAYIQSLTQGATK